VTSTAVRRVAAQLGLQVSRVRSTRPGDADSLGNGNWHVWTGDGHRLVLRRYHTLRTEQDLSYESQVLRHLAARGWSVPAPAAGPLAHGGRLWAATRYVAGRPRQTETPAHREQRGSILARLHGDLRDLELGQRPWFYRGCELDLMGAFQEWDAGVLALQAERADLAEWATAAMANAKQEVADRGLSTLPGVIVHGDFAGWNLHFSGSRLTGVIDFDLTHQDSRAWEFVLARMHRTPELIEGYERTAAELGFPLSAAEKEAVEPLERVFRVNMVMAELWGATRTGRFDFEMIERRLSRTGTAARWRRSTSRS
jgi:homoserine kinase type II